MRPSTKLSCGVFIVLFCAMMLQAQETEATGETEKKKNRFSIMFGGAAGNFANSESKFNTIYSNRTISRIYMAGIGTNTFYFIGKYREFSALGKSVVANIAVAGKADWKQKFYSAGLRLHADDHPIYAEVLYVFTRAEEVITTKDPVVEELTAKEITENKGVGFTVGIALKIAGPIGIFVEGEYSMMLKKGRNQYGRANPELGGICASAGIQFVL